MNYWLVIRSPENFYFDSHEINFKVIGFSDWYRNTVSNVMCSGDRIIYYIKEMMVFGAICTIVGDVFESDTLLWSNSDKKWPLRRHSKPDIVLSEKNFVDARQLIHKLSFVKNKLLWGSHFQRSIQRLTFEDFNLIEMEIKRALKNN